MQFWRPWPRRMLQLNCLRLVAVHRHGSCRACGVSKECNPLPPPCAALSSSPAALSAGVCWASNRLQIAAPRKLASAVRSSGRAMHSWACDEGAGAAMQRVGGAAGSATHQRAGAGQGSRGGLHTWQVLRAACPDCPGCHAQEAIGAESMPDGQGPPGHPVVHIAALTTRISAHFLPLFSTSRLGACLGPSHPDAMVPSRF
jgi:hypothetical protein